jgi:hypothetical protein
VVEGATGRVVQVQRGNQCLEPVPPGLTATELPQGCKVYLFDPEVCPLGCIDPRTGVAAVTVVHGIDLDVLTGKKPGPPLPGAVERARAVLRVLDADPSLAPPGLDAAAALGGRGAEAAAAQFLDTACALGCVPALDGEIDFHTDRLGEAGYRVNKEVAQEHGLA